MNRRKRRKAKVQSRGYLDPCLKAWGKGTISGAGLHHVFVEHDHWCAIHQGGACNCHPNVHTVRHQGSEVIEIDDDDDDDDAGRRHSKS